MFIARMYIGLYYVYKHLHPAIMYIRIYSAILWVSKNSTNNYANLHPFC